MVSDAVVAHYQAMQRMQLAAVAAARKVWEQVDPANLTGTWLSRVQLIAPVIKGNQVLAATSGTAYVSAALAETGAYVPPTGFIDPLAFAGSAADGRALETLLYSPVTTTKEAIRRGMTVANALQVGRAALDTITRTTIADAGRASAGVSIAARPGVGYVRALNPPSCGRCAILAGKWYRWNRGFLRHPRCDCLHVPSVSRDAAESEGLILDPYKYFRSLSQRDQVRLFGKAESQAIQDGADVFQVVNAKRGLKVAGDFNRSNMVRLTPEAIYKQGLSRTETLKLLQEQRYILPGGQDPLGVIRGQVEGWGKAGRGGTRVGARQAVERARETGAGVMTAEERRAFDTRVAWAEVVAGRNPHTTGPLTPQVAASVEADYMRLLATETTKKKNEWKIAM